MGDDGGGSLTSLDGAVPIQMVSVSTSVIFSYAIKSRRSLFFLAPAHLGSSGTGKSAVKRLCVCVYVCVCVPQTCPKIATATAFLETKVSVCVSIISTEATYFKLIFTKLACSMN